MGTQWKCRCPICTLTWYGNPRVTPRRVLGEQRYELADFVVSSEAGEEGEADVHHALGLRDHNGAPPEPRQPVSLPGVVALDAVGLI